MKLPLISICIPTYNGERYLQEALDSINKQTYSNFEVIISDDSSKDNTLIIVENFKKTVNFPVFIFEHKPTGIGANWNHCIKKSKGEYIKFLFQDDVLEPNCLEEQLKDIQKLNLSVICSARTIIDSASQEVVHGKWFESFGNLHRKINFVNDICIYKKETLRERTYFTFNFFGEPDTFLYHKTIFENVGFFSEEYKQLLDLEFSYRILDKYNIGIINKKLLKFRYHPFQASNINLKLNIMEESKLDMEVVRRFFKYVPFKLKLLYLYNKFRILKSINNYRKIAISRWRRN